MLVVVFLAMLALAPAQQSAHAETTAADGDLIGNISVRHEIDFGKEVRVRLDADVNQPVLEVRAIFAPVGPRRVSSYSYPDFNISPDGRTLDASFAIRTGGSAYVPPGTEFELFFEFTATDGSVTSTVGERILYLDPTKDWRLLSRPGVPLEFHYYGFPASLADVLANRAEAAWLDIAASIGLAPESVDTFKAVIYPNIGEIGDAFPPTSAAASDGFFFGGFAMQRFGVFVLGGPNPDSVVHEFTHLLIGAKVSSPLASPVPSWLHEGLAQFFEAGSSRGYTARLGQAASADALLTMRNRNSVPARANEISLFYAQVGSFVGELIEGFGPEPMAETLGLINDGRSAAEAIEIAYGQPLWQLENEWRRRLGASELPAPPEPTATPERVGGQPTPGALSTSNAAADGDAPTGDEVADVGVVASDREATPQPASDDGFNWRGPLVGAAAAAVVFLVWSFRVNRRRYRSLRR